MFKKIQRLAPLAFENGGPSPGSCQEAPAILTESYRVDVAMNGDFEGERCARNCLPKPNVTTD
jgi:hypothetical protein